ncbi:F-box/kelch-repeat protein [Forsythia ovata]|uniref:F-box/kelch-repeat protein n=1 Tax=Forsythia ovata TaxID=205694 RepID=A0ABD1WCV1_9LAMI
MNTPATSAYRFTVFEPERGYWTELSPVPRYSDGLPMNCQLVGARLNLIVMGGLNPVTWKFGYALIICIFSSVEEKIPHNEKAIQGAFEAAGTGAYVLNFGWIFGGYNGYSNENCVFNEWINDCC